MSLPRPFRVGRVAALPAAVIVYMLVFLATMLLPAMARALTAWSGAAGVVAVLLAVPMCSWSVRLVRRFGGRLVPLHASGERMIAPALACSAGALVAAAGGASG